LFRLKQSRLKGDLIAVLLLGGYKDEARLFSEVYTDRRGSNGEELEHGKFIRQACIYFIIKYWNRLPKHVVEFLLSGDIQNSAGLVQPPDLLHFALSRDLDDDLQ